MVGAVCLTGQGVRRELSFAEILLDETLIQGEVWVRKKALRNVGGLNYRLGAKRTYELLVRIAKEYRVLQAGEEDISPICREAGIAWVPEEERVEEWICLKSENREETGDSTTEDSESWKTDCYLIGRYKAELLSMGCFDDAVMGILSAGMEERTQYLERMLTGTKEYYDIYDCTQPILIYVGSNLCYNILDTFARSMGHALEGMGQCVEYFDLSKQQMKELDGYTNRRFKAVIGMQTHLFSVKREKGGFVHDEMEAPIYHFVFDHPIRLKEHLQQAPRKMCVLTSDGNYAEFIQNYYGHSARFLPPAGNGEFYEGESRDYEIAFLGSYGDGNILEELRCAREQDRKSCYLLNRYILYMRRNLGVTPEQALQKTLDYYGIICTREGFLEILYEQRWAFRCLSYYYRKKVIEILLRAGIHLHVFGDSWKRSPMWGHPGLIWHEKVTWEDALKVYARAKLSLNIMTWHKDGFTERIANSMLQKSVVVTDRTTYLEKHFVNGEDLLMFDLGYLAELPGRVKGLLADEEKRKQMAENGYRKAVQQHTWHQRAEKILGFIEEDRGQDNS